MPDNPMDEEEQDMLDSYSQNIKSGAPCPRYFTTKETECSRYFYSSWERRSFRWEAEGPSNVRTPLRNLTNSSCSEDWRMSSGEKSGTGKSLKLKRLRTIGDLAKTRRQLNTKTMASCSSASLASPDGYQAWQSEKAF